MRKAVIAIILTLFILIAAVSLVKDAVVKSFLVNNVYDMTGFRLDMDSLNVSLINTSIDIKGLKLFNPEGYPDKLMIDMPEVYMDYDLGAFLRNESRFRKMRLHLNEFVVVRNKHNELNLDSLKLVDAVKNISRNDALLPGFRIDVLELKINRALYKDYSKSIKPKIREYNVNINAQYRNITDPYTFLSLVVAEALTKTPISRLANFDLTPFKERAAEAYKKTKTAIQSAASDILEKSKEMGDATKNVLKETSEKTEDALKKILPAVE